MLAGNDYAAPIDIAYGRYTHKVFLTDSTF